MDFIQKIIDKKNCSSYLEIGCDDDLLFSKVKVKEKIGVDPVSGGNFRGTSDEFFDQNKDYFDCIFIDGLHEYDQVYKDIKNSIKFLKMMELLFYMIVYHHLFIIKQYQDINLFGTVTYGKQ